MHAALQIAEKVAEQANELPFSPVVFGVAPAVRSTTLNRYADNRIGTSVGL